MVDYYFNNSDDYGYLFTNRLIAKQGDKYWDMHNSYPVVHINMKSIFCDDEDSLYENFSELMSLIYRKFYFLKNSERLNEIDIEEFNSICLISFLALLL